MGPDYWTGDKGSPNPKVDAQHRCFETPWGPIRLTMAGDMVTGLRFAEAEDPLETEDKAPLAEAVVYQVLEFLEGKRREFCFPMSVAGTAFQRRVWQETVRIPYGQTITYRALATLLGNPSASVAVGAALAANPLLLVVPCHRVIASTGSLQGYAGGLWRKRRLLQMESGSSPQHLLFPETDEDFTG